MPARSTNPDFISADTSVEAYEVQGEAFRRMSGAERCAIAFRLNEFARRVSEAGIRQRHPEYDDARVHQALLRLRLGDTLMRTIWPNVELVEP